MPVAGKNAVVTVAIGEEHCKLARLTHPAMLSYAQQLEADFIVIDSFPDASKTPHFAKFQLYQLLGTYSRIIYVDSDALIVGGCPDLFQLVPEMQLGVFLEENESEATHRTNKVQAICGTINGWKGTFFNSGVMVLSSYHRAMFDPTSQQISVGAEFEQAQLNWNAQKLGLSIFDIGRHFNHIVWELDESRYNSFIIHYVSCCPPRWLSRRQKVAVDKFILSVPKPIRPALIAARCYSDAAITSLLRWTLPMRRLVGVYNKPGGGYVMPVDN